MNSEKQYIDLFETNRDTISAHSTAVMNAPRQAAFEDFKRLGFPTRKNEKYKYTDISKLFEPDYGLNLQRLPMPIDPYEVFSCDVPRLSTANHFVVNDAFLHPTTPHKHLPEGVVITSLCDYAEKDPDFIAKYYGKLAKTDADAVTALNTMLAQDGLLVYVPRGVRLEQTIQVINILHADVDLMVNRRVLIVVEPLAEAKFLFCDHTFDDRRFLATQVIEAFVGDNARLDLYCMEETHEKNVRVSNVYIEQQATSRVNHNVITLHNGVTRNNVSLVFRGEGAECNLSGCVIADKKQHVDNNTLIDHAVPNCQSNELYKYVLDDEAIGAFSGLVFGAAGCPTHRFGDAQPKHLCHQKGAHVHPTDARNLRRRREMCAWGHRGAAQRCCSFLHAPAWHQRKGGQTATRVCFHQ